MNFIKIYFIKLISSNLFDLIKFEIIKIGVIKIEVGVGQRLLQVAWSYLPNLFEESMLRLEFPVEDEDAEFKVVTLISATLQEICSRRKNKAGI